MTHSESLVGLVWKPCVCAQAKMLLGSVGEVVVNHPTKNLPMWGGCAKELGRLAPTAQLPDTPLPHAYATAAPIDTRILQASFLFIQHAIPES